MVSISWRVISWSVVGGVILWLGMGLSEVRANQPAIVPAPQMAKNLKAEQAKKTEKSRKAEQAKQKVRQIMQEEEQAQILLKLYEGQVFLLRDGRTIRRGGKTYTAPFFLTMSMEHDEFFRETPEARTFAQVGMGVDITGRIFLGLAAGSVLSLSVMLFAAPQVFVPASGNFIDSPAFWIGSVGGLCLLLGISLIASVPVAYGAAISMHNHRMFEKNYQRLAKRPFPHRLEHPNQQSPNIQPMQPPVGTPLAPPADGGRLFLYEAR